MVAGQCDTTGHIAMAVGAFEIYVPRPWVAEEKRNERQSCMYEKWEKKKKSGEERKRSVGVRTEATEEKCWGFCYIYN